MILTAQPYLDASRRMADIVELVDILDAAASETDSAAVDSINRLLSYYRHREWSLRVQQFSCGHREDHAASLPYIDADGSLTTIEAADWQRFEDFDGFDRFFNPVNVVRSSVDLSPDHVRMRAVVNSNSSVEIYARLSRPANIITLSREQGDLYYGGRYVVCHPSITTQPQLFALLKERGQ